MSEGWERIESMVRDVGLTEGLSAPLADPLWLLSRQWQVGEFGGDDAAQPAAVRVTRRSYPLTSLRSGGTTVPFPTGRPLEAVVEGDADTDLGSAGLYAAARAGHRLLTALRGEGLGTAVDALRSAFPNSAPAAVLDVGERWRAPAELLARWGIDAAAIAAASAARVRTALGTTLSPAEVSQASAVVAAWRVDYLERSRTPLDCWDSRRMEYAFTVTAEVDGGELVLEAPEHDGGHLDWYTFDVAGQPQRTPDGGATATVTHTTTAVPAPVRYPGMPASRWWELEAQGGNFGDISAGPADLARLLVAEFTVAYSDDWFLLPLPVPAASVTEVRRVEVFDTFGGRTVVPSTAMLDSESAGADRAWRLFELSGDEVSAEHPAPWLLVASPLGSGLHGPALERVTFSRDEAANLAWGVEHLIEGPLGRAVRRAETWRDVNPAAPAPVQASAAVDGTNGAWRYRLDAPAPAWWIPLRPERIDPTSSQVRLRRARMQAWELLTGEPAGPRSTLLDPRGPQWFYEEEVPRAGVEVLRSWQFARWLDGSVHVWRQRRKRPGRPASGSGPRWDVIDG